MQLKPIRKGTVFGWYSTPQTYNVYFKDADNDLSYPQYKEESFEYLNTTRYNSPLFPLNAISDFFSTTLKKVHEKDQPGYNNQFLINMIYVSNERYLHYFKNHFPHVTFTFEKITEKNYRVLIVSKTTLHELVHLAYIFSLFLALASDEYVEMSNQPIEKYIRSIQAIDAPYYIRYLFVRYVLTNRKLFHEYKEQLEKTERYSITFSFGHTALQRRNWIESQLAFNKPIVDIGCGEGFYAIPFSEKLAEIPYYAIDINKNIIENLNKIVKEKELKNITTFTSFESFLNHYKNRECVHVLMTEVVEHMDVQAATNLIQNILGNVAFETFIITTPNRDFNIFYKLENDRRHEDHYWEMDTKEFKHWLNSITDLTKFSITFSNVGDEVNGISITQAAIIRRKDGIV